MTKDELRMYIETNPNNMPLVTIQAKLLVKWEIEGVYKWDAMKIVLVGDQHRKFSTKKLEDFIAYVEDKCREVMEPNDELPSYTVG